MDHPTPIPLVGSRAVSFLECDGHHEPFIAAIDIIRWQWLITVFIDHA